jgi:hypothetical protein
MLPRPAPPARKGLVGAVVTLILLVGCNGPAALGSGARETPTTVEAPVPDDELADDELPAAAATFTAHFSDPLYEDPAGEFAPFGTDEGFDLLCEWDERRDELGPDTTVADLIEGAGMSEVAAGLDTREEGKIPRAGGPVDAATVIVAGGFTLLRLSGRIDDEGKQLTLKALDVLLSYYDSPPELLRQRADLESWHG